MNKFDPILGEYRQSDAGAVTVSEYDNEDKPSAVAGDVWVKKTFVIDGEVGVPRGLLLALTYSGDGVSTYELSYKNVLNNVIRTSLS